MVRIPFLVQYSRKNWTTETLKQGEKIGLLLLLLVHQQTKSKNKKGQRSSWNKVFELTASNHNAGRIPLAHGRNDIIWDVSDSHNSYRDARNKFFGTANWSSHNSVFTPKPFQNFCGTKINNHVFSPCLCLFFLALVSSLSRQESVSDHALLFHFPSSRFTLSVLKVCNRIAEYIL